MKDEISPMREAIVASSMPSQRIQSRSSILGLAALQEVPRAPTELSPDRLAEALAVVLSDLIDVLPGYGAAARDRLANRLFERGLASGGTEASKLLSAIAGAMIKLES